MLSSMSMRCWLIFLLWTTGSGRVSSLSSSLSTMLSSMSMMLSSMCTMLSSMLLSDVNCCCCCFLALIYLFYLLCRRVGTPRCPCPRCCCQWRERIRCCCLRLHRPRKKYKKSMKWYTINKRRKKPFANIDLESSLVETHRHINLALTIFTRNWLSMTITDIDQ